MEYTLEFPFCWEWRSWAVYVPIPTLWVEGLVGDLRAGMGDSREEGSSPCSEWCLIDIPWVQGVLRGYHWQDVPPRTECHLTGRAPSALSTGQCRRWAQCKLSQNLALTWSFHLSWLEKKPAFSAIIFFSWKLRLRALILFLKLPLLGLARGFPNTTYIGDCLVE